MARHWKKRSIATPNLDRIASEGLLFTQFYNNGKCTTTRASLLTGLYPRKGGKGIELLSPDMVTLGEAMKLAGYQTGLSGKWHNGSKEPHRPFDRGFDKSYGLWDGCSNFFDRSRQRLLFGLAGFPSFTSARYSSGFVQLITLQKAMEWVMESPNCAT